MTSSLLGVSFLAIRLPRRLDLSLSLLMTSLLSIQQSAPHIVFVTLSSCLSVYSPYCDTFYGLPVFESGMHPGCFVSIRQIEGCVGVKKQDGVRYELGYW